MPEMVLLSTADPDPRVYDAASERRLAGLSVASGTILVVEDEQSIGSLVHTYLARSGTEGIGTTFTVRLRPA